MVRMLGDFANSAGILPTRLFLASKTLETPESASSTGISPTNRFFCKYRNCKFVISPISVGIRPLKRFFQRNRLFKALSCEMVVGSVPLKLFSPNVRRSREGIVQMLSGTVPESWFVFRSNRNNVFISPNSFGKLPVRLLMASRILSKEGSFVSSVGTFPEMPCLTAEWPMD